MPSLKTKYLHSFCDNLFVSLKLKGTVPDKVAWGTQLSQSCCAGNGPVWKGSTVWEEK